MTVSKDTNNEVDIFDFASLYLFGSQHTNDHAFREGRKERDLTFNTLWMNMLCAYKDAHHHPVLQLKKKKKVQKLKIRIKKKQKKEVNHTPAKMKNIK